MSCVMSMKEASVSALIPLRTFMMLACVSMSSAEVGSSSTMRSGEVTRAMAMATRWRIPPLNSNA